LLYVSVQLANKRGLENKKIYMSKDIILEFTLYPQKLAITSPTGDGRSVGIVRLRTQTMEFFYLIELYTCEYTLSILLACSSFFPSLKGEES
jgi:hypothetical protein